MSNKMRKRYFKTPAVLFTALLMMCGVSAFALGGAEDQKSALNQRKPATVNQDLIIQTADIKEYIDFYPVEIDGLKMEIMIVKAPDSTIRTAFNICHFCYQRDTSMNVTGYYVQMPGPQLVSLCGSNRKFTMSQIQISSNACHPEPILPENRITAASTVTITREYLRRAKTLFAEMKKLNEKGSCCD